MDSYLNDLQDAIDIMNEYAQEVDEALAYIADGTLNSTIKDALEEDLSSVLMRAEEIVDMIEDLRQKVGGIV